MGAVLAPLVIGLIIQMPNGVFISLIVIGITMLAPGGIVFLLYETKF